MTLRRALAATLAGLVASCWLAGCEWMPGKPTEAERPVLASQVTNFGALYRQNCAGCHGIDGRWGAARPLNDPLYLALIKAATLRQIIRQGVSGTTMPAFAQSAGGRLSEQQIAVLVEGMRRRWGQSQQFQGVHFPPYSLQEALATYSGPGDPQRGQQAYTTYCAHCHGSDGTGGTHGGSVVDAAFLALVSDQGLRTTVIAGRPDLGMPDWRAAVPGRPMTAQEISDVVAWLVSHRRASPTSTDVKG